MRAFTSDFDIRDRVVIDGDTSLIGTITAVQFRLTREPVYEVSFIHNGQAQSPWIEGWRLVPQGGGEQ